MYLEISSSSYSVHLSIKLGNFFSRAEDKSLHLNNSICGKYKTFRCRFFCYIPSSLCSLLHFIRMMVVKNVDPRILIMFTVFSLCLSLHSLILICSMMNQQQQQQRNCNGKKKLLQIEQL